MAEVILMFKDSIGHYPPFTAQQKLLVAPTRDAINDSFWRRRHYEKDPADVILRTTIQFNQSINQSSLLYVSCTCGVQVFSNRTSVGPNNG